MFYELMGINMIEKKKMFFSAIILYIYNIDIKPNITGKSYDLYGS